MPENIIKQLKKFRVDTTFEKKKHYNAADRKKKYHNILVIVQIAINAITGTTLLTAICGNSNKTAEIIALCLTITSTIFAGIQKAYKFDKQSQGNTKMADMYLRLAKKINLFLSCIDDGMISNDDIMKETNKIQEEICQTNELSAQFSTNNVDYRKAKKGIENGEENYTETEFHIGE